jgi:Flp pilus assembly protein TadD
VLPAIVESDAGEALLTEDAGTAIAAETVDAGSAVAAETLDAGVAEPSAADAGTEPVAPPEPAVIDAGAPPEPPPGDPADLGEGASVDQLVSRADALREGGNLVGAERHYTRALERDPRENHAMEGMARVMIARGDGAAAIHWAEEAIARRARRSSYHVLLGDARQVAGDAEGARAAWRAALELDPEDRDARRRLNP